MYAHFNKQSRLNVLRSTTGISLGLALAATAMPVHAQSGGADDMNTIIVTGIRGIERSVIDSPTPVDVIGSDDLTKTGQTDLLAQLNTVVPSFNVPAQGGGGTSFVIASGGLRGLNVDQTLVLVNGKRRHRAANINARGALSAGSQPVDFSLLPNPAIARVEVLRDGASAQYGSDAMAGVINIITKRDTTDGRLTAQFGENFDRNDGRKYQISGFKGFDLPMDGSLVLAFDVRKQSPSNRAFPIGPEQQLYFPIDGEPDPREATADRLVSLNMGQPQQKAKSASYDLSIPLGGETEFYSYGMLGQRETLLVWDFRRANQSQTLPEFFPNGFNPKTTLAERDFDVAAGIRSVIAGWDVDLATTYGTNRFRLDGFDTLNASLGLESPTEFYYGTQKQYDWNNSFDVTRGFDVGGSNLQVSLGLLHRYERYVIEAGDPRSLAAGDYRWPDDHPVFGCPEAERPNCGTRPPPGAQGQTAFLESEASDTSRNNLAAYVDLAWDVTDKLFLGAAVRQEHFDDSAGDSTIFKVTGRYEVTPWLAVRGAVNTGFKAPTLGQTAYGSTSSNFTTVPVLDENGNPVVDGNGQPVTEQLLNLTKFLAVNSSAADALGATPLVPEKSLSFSAGITAEPLDGLTLTIDGYSIKVKDRITLTEELRGPEVQQILTDNGITAQVDAARYFTNAVDTRTSGVDVVASYRFNLGETGSFTSSLSFNYNKTKIIDVIPNPPELDALGPDYVLFGRSVQGAPLRNPKTKAVWTNTYRNDKLAATIQVSQYGDYEVVATNALDDYVVNGKIITNADITYNFTDTLSLGVGANNLFNVYPDWTQEPSATRGNGYLPGGVGYGITGGSYYVRLGINF